MSRVKVGIIGTSGFGISQHYANLAKFDDVELAALCEPLTERREQVAREFHIPRQYHNHVEMLEKETLDAVYAIMAPHRSFDVAYFCIKAGMPVFLEKPGVVNAYQAQALADAAAKSGALTMVGFNRRFMPIMNESRRLVKESGEIIHCVSTYYKHSNEPAGYYGGAISYLQCDAIHAVDALRWMGGDVVKVSGIVSTYDADAFNAVSGLVRFESGATGVLLTNWTVATRVHTFEMHTHNVSAFVNPDDTAVILTTASEPRNPGRTVIGSAQIAGSSERVVMGGFMQEDRHFIDCVKARRQPETNLADAVKTHRLVEDLLRNAM